MLTSGIDANYRCREALRALPKGFSMTMTTDISSVSFVSGFGQYHSSNHASRPQPYGSVSFADIEAMIRQPQAVDKAQAQWFIPSNLHSRVKTEQLENGQFYGLWADIDEPDGVDLETFATRLASFLSCKLCAYTTKSATEAKQKCRIIIPIAEAVSGADYELYQTALNNLIADNDITPDRATQRANQICYLPNRGNYYQHVIIEGDLLQPADQLDIATVQQQQQEKHAKVQTTLELSVIKAKSRLAAGQTSVINAFNDSFDLADVLAQYGYELYGSKWLSPLSESGAAGVTVNDNRWISAHYSDVMAGIGRSNGSSCSGDAFDLYCFYDHDNDRDAALRALGEHLTTSDGLSVTQANQRAYMAAQEAVLPQINMSKLQNRNNRNDEGGNFLPFRPLNLSSLTPAAYPTQALGQTLEDACMALSQTIQAPIPMIANSLLAAASLAAQPFANIQLLHGKDVPISCFFITIGDSGERKSAVDAYVGKPISLHQQQLQAEYKQAWQDYQNHLEAYEEARKQAKKGKFRDAIAANLAAVGAAPEKPLHGLILCSDPTVEGIYRQLNEGQSSIGLFSDEGGLFAGGHAMSQDTMLATLARLSKLWDGSPFDRVRGGDGIGLLANRRMSLHLMMQSVVADDLLSSTLANGQGFLPRCLVAYPQSTAGTRNFVDINPETLPAIQRYYTVMNRLLGTQKPTKPEDYQQLDPKQLTLSASAKARLICFHDDIERQVGNHGKYQNIKGFANKTVEHTARLAGILHVMQTIENSSDSLEVDLSTIEKSITLMQWYLDHWLAINERNQANEGITLASLLIDDVRKLQGHHAPYFYKQPIQNKGSNQLRNKSVLDQAIKTLIEHGMVRLVTKRKLDGAMRQEVYELRESDCDCCDFCDSEQSETQEVMTKSQESQESQPVAP